MGNEVGSTVHWMKNIANDESDVIFVGTLNDKNELGGGHDVTPSVEGGSGRNIDRIYHSISLHPNSFT